MVCLIWYTLKVLKLNFDFTFLSNYDFAFALRLFFKFKLIYVRSDKSNKFPAESDKAKLFWVNKMFKKHVLKVFILKLLLSIVIRDEFIISFRTFKIVIWWRYYTFNLVSSFKDLVFIHLFSHCKKINLI